MAAKEISTPAIQHLLSDKKSDSAAPRKSRSAPDFPGCMAHLDNIKARWINARTAYLAHDATRARNERFRQCNNWATLVLAVLTAVSAVLLPVLGTDSTGILILTITTAILTSASKVIEQTFARPEDILVHLTAVGILRGNLDALNVVAGQLHNYVLGQRDLDFQYVHGKVQALGEAIEETRRNHIVSESRDHIAQAENDFETTPIGVALRQTRHTIQVVYQVQFGLVTVEKSIESGIKAIL